MPTQSLADSIHASKLSHEDFLFLKTAQRSSSRWLGRGVVLYQKGSNSTITLKSVNALAWILYAILHKLHLNRTHPLSNRQVRHLISQHHRIQADHFRWKRLSSDSDTSSVTSKPLSTVISRLNHAFKDLPLGNYYLNFNHQKALLSKAKLCTQLEIHPSKTHSKTFNFMFDDTVIMIEKGGLEGDMVVTQLDPNDPFLKKIEKPLLTEVKTLVSIHNKLDIKQDLHVVSVEPGPNPVQKDVEQQPHSTLPPPMSTVPLHHTIQNKVCHLYNFKYCGMFTTQSLCGIDISVGKFGSSVHIVTEDKQGVAVSYIIDYKGNIRKLKPLLEVDVGFKLSWSKVKSSGIFNWACGVINKTIDQIPNQPFGYLKDPSTLHYFSLSDKNSKSLAYALFHAIINEGYEQKEIHFDGISICMDGDEDQALLSFTPSLGIEDVIINNQGKAFVAVDTCLKEISPNHPAFSFVLQAIFSTTHKV